MPLTVYETDILKALYAANYEWVAFDTIIESLIVEDDSIWTTNFILPFVATNLYSHKSILRMGVTITKAAVSLMERHLVLVRWDADDNRVLECARALTPTEIAEHKNEH